MILLDNWELKITNKNERKDRQERWIQQRMTEHSNDKAHARGTDQYGAANNNNEITLNK